MENESDRVEYINYLPTLEEDIRNVREIIDDNSNNNSTRELY